MNIISIHDNSNADQALLLNRDSHADSKYEYLDRYFLLLTKISLKALHIDKDFPAFDIILSLRTREL